MDREKAIENIFKKINNVDYSINELQITILTEMKNIIDNMILNDLNDKMDYDLLAGFWGYFNTVRNERKSNLMNFIKINIGSNNREILKEILAKDGLVIEENFVDNINSNRSSDNHATCITSKDYPFTETKTVIATL